MANYNIEMQYYNGSSYDTLYPNIPISAVSDWEDNVYSKNEANSKFGNASYNMDLFGTYVVTSSNTSLGGHTVLSNVYDNMFEGNYDGFYFVVNYTTNSGSIAPFYILILGEFSICPIYGTNNTEVSISVFVPIVAKINLTSNQKFLVANSFYTTNIEVGTLITAETETRNNREYIDLLEINQVITSQSLRLLGIRTGSGGASIRCTANVSIYKYKLNLNT